MNTNCTKIEINNKIIYLIGTAHVSQLSADEVKHTIEEIKPDTVCIELDKDRYNSLNNPDKWRETDIVEVIKQKKTGYLLANLVLASYQKRVAKKMNVNAGKEMTTAISVAKEHNYHIELVDRNIQTTFTRIYRKHSFFQKFKLIVSLIGSIFEEEDITEADIENLKKSDVLEASLKEVSKSFPVIAEVLIHERDMVLAHKIKNAPGSTIVAVVGAAHVPGILESIQKDYSIDEMESIPPKSISSKIMGWIIPIAIIAMIITLFFQNEAIGLAQLKNWILWNGSLSAIGVLLALGSPLAILTAFVAAPITSLNPLLAAGWFAGLVEAFIKKPKVKDLENLSEDASTLKGLYRNRFTHVLLVVILANLFSTIGTAIGGIDVVTNFLKAILH